MSTGDLWDQYLTASKTSDRQDEMCRWLDEVAEALKENRRLSDLTRFALAESLSRLSSGEDPKNVFGPLKGPRKGRTDLGNRDRLMAMQVHFLVKKNGGKRIYKKACEFVGELHHKGPRTVEQAYDDRRDVLNQVWDSMQSVGIDPFEHFLSHGDRQSAQKFFQKDSR